MCDPFTNSKILLTLHTCTTPAAMACGAGAHGHIMLTPQGPIETHRGGISLADILVLATIIQISFEYYCAPIYLGYLILLVTCNYLLMP